jgi:antitoxin component of RelBE/YafQ-DinJ toxin-antitoxin module
MTNTTRFSTDVDSTVMDQASEVLAADGITVSEAFHKMMNHIVAEKRTPNFECFQPNEETLAAMAEAARGGLVTIGTVADLMAHLNEDNYKTRLWPIWLILIASGMALGGTWAMVAKDAADAGLPWYAFAHSVAAAIMAITPIMIISWVWITKKQQNGRDAPRRRQRRRQRIP